MNPIDLQKEAAKNRQEFRKKLDLLKKQKEGFVDAKINDLHSKAFEKIDCLTCANCCKTTGPLFTDKDIERIAKHLKMKPGGFVDRYLKIDEEHDYVLQTTPCSFLGADNYCSIYEVRPKACAAYPHTDARNQKSIFNLTLKNSEICPAVTQILTEL